MNYFIKIFVFLFLFGSLLSCEYETIKPLKVEVESASFATDVYPLFSTCSTCHNGSHIFDSRDLTKAYTSLTLPANGLVVPPLTENNLMKMISDKHQGTANYSATDIAKIEKWIADGYQNN